MNFPFAWCLMGNSFLVEVIDKRMLHQALDPYFIIIYVITKEVNLCIVLSAGLEITEVQQMHTRMPFQGMQPYSSICLSVEYLSEIKI